MGEYTDKPNERKQLLESLRRDLQVAERAKGAAKVHKVVDQYPRSTSTSPAKPRRKR